MSLSSVLVCTFGFKVKYISKDIMWLIPVIFQVPWYDRQDRWKHDHFAAFWDVYYILNGQLMRLLSNEKHLLCHSVKKHALMMATLYPLILHQTSCYFPRRLSDNWWDSVPNENERVFQAVWPARLSADPPQKRKRVSKKEHTCSANPWMPPVTHTPSRLLPTVENLQENLLESQRTTTLALIALMLLSST